MANSLDSTILNNYGGLDHNSLLNRIASDDYFNEESGFDLQQSAYYTSDDLNLNDSKFTVISLNCQSLRAKYNSILLFLQNIPCKPKAIILQETWLSNGDITSHLNIPGYNLLSKGKVVSAHGGLAIYLDQDFSYKEIVFPDSDIFEFQAVEISKQQNSKKVILCNVYRPPRDLSENYLQFTEELSNICSAISDTDKEVIIGGDYNINLLLVNEKPLFKEYMESIMMNGFFPSITLPTRFTDQNCTLIDNFLIKLSNISLKQVSGVIISSLSDHLPYFISLDLNFKVNCDKYIKIKKMSDNAINNFICDIQGMDLMGKFEMNKPNENYNVLHNEIVRRLNTHFPEKWVKLNHYKHKKSSWMTTEILNTIKYKDKLYKKLKSLSPTSQEYLRKKQEFHGYNKIVKKEIRIAKQAYFQSYFQKHKSNAAKIWTKIKDIIGNKKQNSTRVPTLKVNGVLINNPKEIADNFNNFFSTIAYNDGQSTGDLLATSHLDHLTHVELPNTFSFMAVTNEDVEKIVKALPNKKSQGFDGLSTHLLKKIIPHIVTPLTEVINQSFENGIFPDLLKISKVKPLFKCKDPQTMNNYRPISILPAISKIFEKAMYKQIYNHFQSYNLFFSSQYGFREDHSTQLAALELHNRIHDALNDKHHPFCVFLDLSKAFDLIDHNILVDKFSHYGFSNNAIDLCRNYLSNRKQFVEFGNELSETTILSKGVPQGSILGPLFFLIFINDLPNVSSKFNFIIYADDTSLYSTFETFDENHDGDMNTISQNINNEISNVSDWMNANKLRINTAKTKFMCFRVRQKNISYPNIKLGTDSIDIVTSFNFLGITFDEYLDWSIHISQLSCKLSKIIGILSRLKNELPHTILRMIFNSLFNSHLHYGVLNWGYRAEKIIKLQKRAIRVITNKHKAAHTDKLFKFCNILKFKDIIVSQELKFYYNYTHNNLPKFFYISNFIQIYEPSRYNTRQNPHLRLKVSRLQLTSLKYDIPNTINCCKPNILEKLSTHSIDGMHTYFKKVTIETYGQELCLTADCYACQFS